MDVGIRIIAVDACIEAVAVIISATLNGPATAVRNASARDITARVRRARRGKGLTAAAVDVGAIAGQVNPHFARIIRPNKGIQIVAVEAPREAVVIQVKINCITAAAGRDLEGIAGTAVEAVWRAIPIAVCGRRVLHEELVAIAGAIECQTVGVRSPVEAEHDRDPCRAVRHRER